MKKVFVEPEISVQPFTIEDVITTSSNIDVGIGGLPFISSSALANILGVDIDIQ